MSEHKLRVFLDTNVIFSGLYSSQGPCGMILDRLVEGRIGAVISQQVLEEVIRTMKQKLPEALPALNTLLVNVPLEIAADPSTEAIRPWIKEIHLADAAILASAIAAKPDYFVTGDNHFLEHPVIKERSGLIIVTPARFLKSLEPGRRGNLK